MQKCLTLLLSVLALHLGSTAQAADAPVCINGASDKNLKLYNSFNASVDPLKKTFLSETKSAGGSPACEMPAAVGKQANDLKNIAKASNTPPDDEGVWDLDDKTKSPNELPAIIKRECINASLMRNPGQEGYACMADKKSKSQDREIAYGTVGGKTQQCITAEMVSYIQFAVNSAIKCLSPDAPSAPVDARVIYQKFNNETGFNYSIAWNGGAGIGQMTNIAVEEIADGNGRGILEGVANSSKHSCTGFKDVAKSDLKKRPRINGGNYCDFVSPGDGLARNLIYGVAYYLHMRESIIVPKLFEENPKMSTNREVVSALTAVSYGREGIKLARALASKADRYTEKNNPCKGKLTPDKCYLKMVQGSSDYLKEIKGKMGEMYCLKEGINPASDDCKKKYEAMTDKQLGANECVRPL